MKNDYLEQEETIEEQGGLTLLEFLCANPVEGETTRIAVSERLKGFEFEIGSMTEKQHNKYLKQCIVRTKTGKVVDQDFKMFNELVVLNHCIYPNFNDFEFIQKTGCQTPLQCMYKVLKVGEVSSLAKKIMDFNGFADFDEEVKAAKN